MNRIDEKRKKLVTYDYHTDDDFYFSIKAPSDVQDEFYDEFKECLYSFVDEHNYPNTEIDVDHDEMDIQVYITVDENSEHMDPDSVISDMEEYAEKYLAKISKESRFSGIKYYFDGFYQMEEDEDLDESINNKKRNSTMNKIEEAKNTSFGYDEYSVSLSIFDALPFADDSDDFYNEFTDEVAEYIDNQYPNFIKFGDGTIIKVDCQGKEEEDFNTDFYVKYPKTNKSAANDAWHHVQFDIYNKILEFAEKTIDKFCRKYKGFDAEELKLSLPEEVDLDDEADISDIKEEFDEINEEKKMRYSQRQIKEAKRVAEAHGYKVISESHKSRQDLIKEATEVAKRHGYIVKEADENPEVDDPEVSNSPVADENGLYTIQVTQEELDAIKSILDKVEYEEEGNDADAEQTAGIVTALDSDEIYSAE